MAIDDRIRATLDAHAGEDAGPVAAALRDGLNLSAAEVAEALADGLEDDE